MKQLTALLAFIGIISCSAVDKTPSSQVNVFNGTGLHGHTYPGATTPFGLVELSPDTRIEGWDGCSGYHYSDSAILGFSHTHLSGTGCADLGDFLFTPGLDKAEPLAFSHKAETAFPGYYKVVFPVGITAELTATPRSGVHRYTFSGKGKPVILIDAVHSIGEGTKASVHDIHPDGNSAVEGHRRVSGWAEDRDIYLSARFSVPFESAEPAGKGKLLLGFPEGTHEITVYAGISYTGIDGARLNLKAETDGRSFDSILAEARETWDGVLGTMEVTGGPTAQFYTCLYHTFVCPNLMEDAGGEPYYSTLSLWDTFRSWNPLQTIINPSLVSNMVRSMLDMYRRTGELPIWPLAHSETYTMIGYHSVSVIADAWLRGIRDFDGEEALRAMVASSNRYKGTSISSLYTSFGYIPANLIAESTSQTLEMAYDDWCIARMAEDLGHADIAEEYYRRAESWQNLFDASTGFMRGRNADGTFSEPFDPIASTRDYTEAIPWQARFFVPHDEAGHTALMGGRENMIAALDSLFTYEERDPGMTISDISGWMGQYAHGNEPSHHMAYIYNWLGAPSRTQEIVRELLSTMYGTGPEGVCGNEDCGQMSAWYVLASTGIYPACPGTGEYQLTVPLFKETKIKLGNGRTLTIKTDRPGNRYIKDVTFNGKPVEHNFIFYDDIMEGGELCFRTSAKPFHGRDYMEPPYSMSDGNIVSTPYAGGNLSLFIDHTEISLGCRTAGASIHYTLDGSIPTESSPLYEKPIGIDKSCTVKARGFLEGATPSPIFTVQATKAIFRDPARKTGLRSGCRYTYHLGAFSETAHVLASPAVASGVMAEPSIGSAPDEDHFGYVFSGYIDVPSDGIWEFSLTSDDGSVLDIDGVRTVDNDGSHSAIATFGRIPLKKGLHQYRLIYLEDYEGQHLSWEWKAPGEESFSAVPQNKLFY